MTNATSMYTRQAAAFRNELKQSCAALVGIVQGILADGELHDREVEFLSAWLKRAENVSMLWPGNVIAAQIGQALSDGHISPEERAHLVDTLQKLVGGVLDDAVALGPINALALDDVSEVEVAGRSFCFTGDFVFGPRSICEAAITRRGGAVSAITKKLNYLVIGGLGSPEWKHGSYGTKIEKAVAYRAAGVPLLIVHEDVWANALADQS